MRFIFTFFIFTIFCFGLNAQIDKSEKKSIRIPAIESKEKKDSTKSNLNKEIKSKTGLDKGKNKITGLSVKRTNIDFSKPKKEFSMFDDNKLKHSGEIYEKRWNKQAVEVGIKQPSMSDQFLGEFNVKVEFVNIICRDHEYPDGDLVRIYINEDIIVPSLLLTNGYRRVKVDLADGLNKLDFEALNQGESGPNTAQFLVYDDKGNLISSKEWNLLTGVKATVVFLNEKPDTN
ncbi:hypothetical protein [Winogradskyella sp. 3972H.M.0a.05]|uniref:hypothetical protein n=1 Tax=Winogradskyella sp. 3972H.M.0a.05 TaxID=2950277 RepID=UPI00339B8173